MTTRAPLLQVENLVKYYPIRQGVIPRVVGQVQAVDDISFTLDRGETLGLVGESGCGKTTTGKALVQLLRGQADIAGEARFDGHDLFRLDANALRAARRQIQIIFQDPFASLNPRMTVGAIIGEALTIHNLAPTRQAFTDRVVELLETVGLQPDHMRRYPHEFSGGQRQRIGIARALALEPNLIIGDEPVSALDVSIQAQILNLVMDLQDEFGLTYLFISHNLAVVEHISHHIAVMYLGRIVEYTNKKTLFTSPLHPYTESLLAAVPVPDPAIRRKKIVLQGDVPSPVKPPSGCHFHTRCPYVVDRCRSESPALREIAPRQFVACHLR